MKTHQKISALAGGFRPTSWLPVTCSALVGTRWVIWMAMAWLTWLSVPRCAPLSDIAQGDTTGSSGDSHVLFLNAQGRVRLSRKSIICRWLLRQLLLLTFGMAVTGSSDLNGDGVPDLGRRQYRRIYDGGAIGDGVGAVYILFSTLRQVRFFQKISNTSGGFAAISPLLTSSAATTRTDRAMGCLTSPSVHQSLTPWSRAMMTSATYILF